MRARFVLTVSFCVALVAVLGLASRAAGNVPAPPGQTSCGDMAGPVWHVVPVGEKTGATGSHYTVNATNMPCARARVLVLRLTHMRSPATGLSSSVLPGYTCVTPRAGAPLTEGGCAAGRVLMPTPGVKAFNWHRCQYVLGTGAHPTCHWKYWTP